MAEAQELRVQPHDLVAEQSVLGAIFINPEKLITVREFYRSRRLLQVFPSCHF